MTDRAWRLTGTLAGLALIVLPIGLYLVVTVAVASGLLAMGPNDPPMEALEDWIGLSVWLPILGLILAAFSRAASVTGFIVRMIVWFPLLVVAWFWIVGLSFGGVSGNPF